MIEPTYSEAISSLCPDAKFGIYGNSLDGLEWPEQSSSRLSDEEIEAELKKLQEDYENKKYQRDRQYPELGEQLDQLFHDMTSGKGNKNGEWYKAIAKVKSDNPKP